MTELAWDRPESADPSLASLFPGRPARGQPVATAAGFSIGTPIKLPYSVQLPS